MREGDLVGGRYLLKDGPITGGRSEVWLAHDTVLGQDVALKRARIDDHSARAFVRLRDEARALAKFRPHRNVVTLYDAVQIGQPPAVEYWLVMEYAAGGSLAGRDPICPREAAFIGAQIAGALTALHASGIVHCDVKPGNILLSGNGTAKLTDLDAAHRIPGFVTRTPNRGISYTPDYAAPEVVQGMPVPESDVFSLGATLYALLVGRPPLGDGSRSVGAGPRPTGADDASRSDAGAAPVGPGDTTRVDEEPAGATRPWPRCQGDLARRDDTLGPLRETLDAMLATRPQERPTAAEACRRLERVVAIADQPDPEPAPEPGSTPASRRPPGSEPVYEAASEGGTDVGSEAEPAAAAAAGTRSGGGSGPGAGSGTGSGTGSGSGREVERGSGPGPGGQGAGPDGEDSWRDRWRSAGRLRWLVPLATVAAAVLLVALTVPLPFGDDDRDANGAGRREPSRPAPAQPDQPPARDADPCALVRPQVLARYGDARLDPAYGNFDRCDVIVTDGADSTVDVKVDFSNDPPSDIAPPARSVGPVGVAELPPESDQCTRSLLPGGRSRFSVYVTAHQTDDGPAPLCEMADTAATYAARQLADGTPPPRTVQPAAESLAQLDACTLLDAQALSVVPGIDASDPDVGYGNWECDWRSTTSDIVTDVRFDRGQTSPTPHSRRTRLSGREAVIEPEGDGSDSCRVRVRHREFTDSNGRRAVEEVHLVVDGPQPVPKLCAMATRLATSAAAELPAPRA
ncbi:protein kinase [Streptomyces sp. NPDC057702]|uniref:serine/threonine-protein kinase n=1 Tax=unclassified Streptomyces TaxID=2593676 RepID=UPI0036801626